MAFTSQLYPGEVIIDDSTPESATVVPGMSLGLELPRGHSSTEYNYGGAADPFPSELELPESDWQGMIQESEERKSRLSDLMNLATLPEKDQDGLSYCWIFGPTQAVEVVRMAQGEPYVSLSPASAGGPIKGFRNVGGWGKEGLEWIVEKGLCPSSVWPDTSLNRSLYSEANKALALKYRVTEWYELKPRSVKQLVSCLLRRIPVAVGYNWWSHEVLAVEPLWLDGAVALRIRNQWKGWGEKNFGVLRGGKLVPDDAVAPRVATAVGKV